MSEEFVQDIIASAEAKSSSTEATDSIGKADTIELILIRPNLRHL